MRRVGVALPRVNPDHLEATFRHLGDALRTLATNSDRLRSALAWAAGNWLLDAAALWSFLAALGRYVNPIELFAAYGIANVLAAIPITPGGLGFVEASLPLLLASFGVTKNVALLGVLGWRIVNFWLPIPVGAGAYLSLKLHRGEGLRASRRALADLAVRLPRRNRPGRPDPQSSPAPGGPASGPARPVTSARKTHSTPKVRSKSVCLRRIIHSSSSGSALAWSTKLSRPSSSGGSARIARTSPRCEESRPSAIRRIAVSATARERSRLASWANGLNVAFGVPATW